MLAYSELRPYILIRVADGVAECAMWQVQDGGQALAVFVSEESARRYRHEAQLSEDWRIVQPPQRGLLELLRTSQVAGITMAAVDPNGSRAVRVVSIEEILRAVDGLS
ncbi:MAG: hypothetical protein N2039_09980 [Gemmataceae bacterium]|nr:hypothetical protein [Gemmataceae bacterium]